ncbi:dUTPase [Hydrogenovibrio sp. SC-1]|uniref:dUTP diphosphatase n=1 Tax=Hydrogenovibrio sp. SC-1 TaxID=2065820 RepID=UPI000C7AF5A1|nr:dUTP diphosphatase [Hydrogenovibrio sp. SC-1]PLA74293.1 dUTPase [Hydrogenovibrio sp. SC-1]
MQHKAAIQEMLTLQNGLNEMTNGADWRSGMTHLGKEIDWRRCIVMEAAELVDSYPWKHWKSVDAQVDIENARVELVDIWHFLLSLALEYFELDKAVELLNKALADSTDTDEYDLDHLSIQGQVRIHEMMMAIALQNEDVTEEYLATLAEAFFHSCQVVDLGFEQLYQIYMAKNVLNKFRQDHGYKEGTYLKVWNGKEDNMVMFEIIDTLTEFSAEQLYIRLVETYKTVS